VNTIINGWKSWAFQAALAIIIFLLGLVANYNTNRITRIEDRLNDVVKSRDERTGTLETVDARLRYLETIDARLIVIDKRLQILERVLEPKGERLK